MSLRITLQGTSDCLSASASESRLRPGLMELRSMEVYQPGVRGSLWYCWFDREKGEKTIHDWRNGPKTYAVTELTPLERKLLVFSTPAFSEYAELVTCLRALLQAAGYGEIR